MPQSSTLTYLAGDHLGSTSLAVDASTLDVIQTRYKPWGEVRWTSENKTLPTRYTFTGQYSYVSDDATDLGAAGFDLMFYNARWYDHTTGRFAQADTIVPGGVQGLDRYAYVNNNPIIYTDPTGRDPYWCVNERNPSQCRKDYYAQMKMMSGATIQGYWGISDNDWNSTWNDHAEMGDVVAFYVDGKVQFAMFALDEKTRQLVLWDMTTQAPISNTDVVKNGFMGFYKYQKDSAYTWKLETSLGKNPYGASDVIGDTLSKFDFPLDWQNGIDSHVKFLPTLTFSCDNLIYCAAEVYGIYEYGVVAYGFFITETVSSPWGLTLGTIALMVAIAQNFSEGTPLVVISSGPAPLFPAIPPPVITFPTGDFTSP